MQIVSFFVAFGVALVSALDNGFTSPPMGWSALYGSPFGSVSEENVVGAAKGLVQGGISKFGYEYINLDDWYAIRLPNGTIAGDPKVFPSGMPAVSETIHKLGLKFGVYSAASQETCASRTASQFREVDDANTYAKVWKIDMLKYDSCIDNNGVMSRARYTTMSRALNATGRHIRYSVEGWSPSQGDWGPEVANMWRTGNDIWPSWDSCILHNLYSNNVAAPYMRVGSAFNDPDMLQPPGYLPGNVRAPGLTFTESQSQFVLWAVMKSPLILGVHWDQLATLATEFPEYFSVVTNQELIDINQDRSAQATLVCQTPSLQQQSTGNISLTAQQCDRDRCDQNFIVGGSSSAGLTIRIADGDLCLTEHAAGGLTAEPCGKSSSAMEGQSWQRIARDSQFHLIVSNSTGRCLSHSKGALTLTTEKCVYDGALPPPLTENIGSQLWVWDAQEGQIISGGSGDCLTLGAVNIASQGHGEYSNNGTLHHEVWRGELSAQGKQVVVLFNKGDSSETLSASRTVLGVSPSSSLPVRDIIAHQDLSPLAPQQPLTAQVASHGVRAFVLG